MICIADINIRSYKVSRGSADTRIHKRIIRDIKRFSPEAVGALGEMLGDGVVEFIT